MACPYLNASPSEPENGDENQQNVVVDSDQQHAKKLLNYTDYLCIVTVLSAMNPRSHTDPANLDSPHVHDEHFFIMIHQVFELWFNQILFDLDSIRAIFAEYADIGPHLFNINLRLTRMSSIWKIMINQLQLLQSMTPMEFLEFRSYITPASGFQSHQFRLIEMKLGLTDPYRSSYRAKYFTNTMFKGRQSDELRTAIEETSLLVAVERWLEKIYDSMSFNFLDEYKQAFERFIRHSAEEKRQNRVSDDEIEEDTKKTRRQFGWMTGATMFASAPAADQPANASDPERPESEQQGHQPRMSHKALLAGLMIFTYHQEPQFQRFYEMLSLLIEMDGLMSSWRHEHIVLVQRQIGRKLGSGGTDGFTYLIKTQSEKYRVFIDVTYLSSYLVPRRFFRNLTMEAAPRIQAMTLGSYSEVPVVRQANRHNRQDRAEKYYDGLLFLFLFMMGALFSVLIHRIAY